MSTFDSDDEVLARLEHHRVPSGPVMNPAAAIDHPWFRETGTVREVSDGHGGAFAIPGFPIRFGGRKPEADLAPPNLGAQTDEILTEAGFASDEIEALAVEGIIQLP